MTLLSVILFGVAVSSGGDSIKAQVDTTFEHWLEQNRDHLATSVELGDNANVQCRYVPFELISRNSVQSATDLNLETELEKNQSLVVFDLRLSVAGLPNPLSNLSADQAEYGWKVQHLNGEILHDLKLVQGADTLNAVSVHQERNYGHAPYVQFRVMFERKEMVTGDPVLVYDDKLFNWGRTLFVYPKELIYESPGN